MNNHILATLADYDSRNIANTGWEYTLYADGRVAAEYCSRWQGSRTGQRYITEPGYIDVSKLSTNDPDNDAEAALAALADEGIDFAEDPAWRCTRRGIVIR